MSSNFLSTVKYAYSADGSTTLSEKPQARERVFYTVNAVRQLLDVAAELLAKRERCSILEHVKGC